MKKTKKYLIIILLIVVAINGAYLCRNKYIKVKSDMKNLENKIQLIEMYEVLEFKSKINYKKSKMRVEDYISNNRYNVFLDEIYSWDKDKLEISEYNVFSINTIEKKNVVEVERSGEFKINLKDKSNLLYVEQLENKFKGLDIIGYQLNINEGEVMLKIDMKFREYILGEL